MVTVSIQIDKLSKKFISYKKQPGIIGSLKSFVNRQEFVNTAVDEFTLDIQQGEFVGLLGPNGAGKTTLMKMMTGIIVPSSGHIRIVGYEPFQRKKMFRKKIALVMGQKSQLWWDVPAYDSFMLLQKYYELEFKSFKSRLDQLSELLDVTDKLHIHVRKLSLGERMKLEIMASLLHQPDVIFLDEPTIGLDVLAQQNIRKFLKEYQKEHNTTIVLTSHYMADVQELCSRIVLILGGKKSFDGPIEKFESLLGKEKFVHFEFSESVNPHKDFTFFDQFDPSWSNDFSQVDLRIPETDLRSATIKILQDFPLINYNCEQLPVERVMKALMEKPGVISE